MSGTQNSQMLADVATAPPRSHGRDKTKRTYHYRRVARVEYIDERQSLYVLVCGHSFVAEKDVGAKAKCLPCAR